MTGETNHIAAISPAVRAANTLTARWCIRMGAEDFVLSGAGLWPLLALLASAADETARAELAAALGRPADTAQQEALELIDVLRGGVSTTAALGLWTRKDIPLCWEWAAGYGRLGWVEADTNGGDDGLDVHAGQGRRRPRG